MKPCNGFTVALFLYLQLSTAHIPESHDDATPALVVRADCRVQKVESGDDCPSLARKCGISNSDFTKYNSNPDPCGSLQPGQQVCCSAGTKPDRRPKQNSDGSCFSYTVQLGDWCDKIAANYDLKTADLYTFNDKKTWGWQGCADKMLLSDTNICLSTGSPPLPRPVANAVCGPIKPGTQKPASNVDIATLNPCPLNACCNKWGQCGITPEFCTAETGPTGNPGTAPPGKNGCISNCGVFITNLQQPAAQINVAYFETWNWDRPCLNLRIQDVDKTQYTHLHWSFLEVDKNNFALIVNDTYGEWQTFKNLKGIKRVISIGGWGFSTGFSTYDIFRRAVTGADQNLKFAMNIINFLKEHQLDGVDLDWEYPGAPDNQGEAYLPPKGDPWDGGWYYILLDNLRKNMPQGKTISIAAPASYWYLKGGFPIKEMATKLDYIVFMTYDLHGQWDFNNKWSQEGCPEGNCLRSHINNTETAYALAMITKAGVLTSKIVVGVSSYGRSFGMVDKNCDGPMCRYKGKESTAAKGRCTNVAGYISNAEINEIIAKGGSDVRTRYDAASMSNILVYGDGQYVAYMNDTTKAQRKANYKAFSFAGTADWAVDLQSFTRPVAPGSFVPADRDQWDLTSAEIVRRYGTGGWDLNSRIQDLCIFYHGSFREEADAYICWNRPNANFRLMADMFIDEAFDENNGPRAAARRDNMEREWFRRLSTIFASVCYGTTRVLWDGFEPMNIGSMTSPDWHSQWDWYEWPILDARVQAGSARILMLHPRTWALSVYRLPSDHSTPPPGFAPAGTRPPKLRVRESEDLAPIDLDGWPSVYNSLGKRAGAGDCKTNQTCHECVIARRNSRPNTERAYAYFDDDRPWDTGDCEMGVTQYKEAVGDGRGNFFIHMNVSVADDSGMWLGGAQKDFRENYGTFVHTNLPAPISVTPWDQASNYNLSFNWRGKSWSNTDQACKTDPWKLLSLGPSEVDDQYSRYISCIFRC